MAKTNIKKIIRNNSKSQYKISKKKYPYLYELFQHDKELRKLYFSIGKYLKKREPYKYDNKNSFHLTTDEIKAIRKKTGDKTANHYINFLCAMGLIRKHTQSKNPNIEGMTKINQDFIKGKPENYKPMNTFYFYSLRNEERLEEINSRCKVLIDAHITKGNITKHALEIEGLDELAEEIYSEVKSKAGYYGECYCEIYSFLKEHIQRNGYATMQTLYMYVILKDHKNTEEIDKVLSAMRTQFKEDFRYGKPNAEEKAKYQLKSDRWIITEHPTEEK